MDRVEVGNEKNVNEDYVLNKIGGDGIVSAYFIIFSQSKDGCCDQMNSIMRAFSFFVNPLFMLLLI